MSPGVWLLVLGLLAPLQVAAERGEPAAERDDLGRALEAYAQGLDTAERDLRLEHFRRAERHFDAVVRGGVRNADLYSNLGNAALLGERPGNAVLAYRRALQLDPDHAGARKNLEHVRSLLPGWVPKPAPAGVLDTFFFWHRALSGAERAGLAALMFAIATTLLAAALYWRRTWLRNLALVPALLWLMTGISLAADAFANTAIEAVLTAPESVARAADSVNAPTRFSRPLPGGVEVSVLERRENWLRIGLADGREAWVSTSSVTAIAGP